MSDWQGWTGTTYTAAAAMIATQATQYHVSATQTAASNRHSNSSNMFTTTQCSQQQQQPVHNVMTTECFDSRSAQYISEMKETIALMPAGNVSTFAQVRSHVSIYSPSVSVLAYVDEHVYTALGVA
jgi:hypothetical protein